MSGRRGVRVCLAAVATFGVLLTVAAPADAVPPKRVSPPQITVTPTSPSRSTTATFTWTEATSGVTFTCLFDGGTVPCGTTRSKTFTGLTERTHTFTVKATRPGYKQATSSRSFTVDLTPPAAPTVSAPPAATNNVVNPVAPTFTDTSSDVARYECSLDAAAFVGCVSGARIDAAPDGRHTLAVRAVDQAGNTSAATTVSWIVDTFVAKPFISAGPAAQTKSTSSVFFFGDVDSDAVLSCSLNGAAFSACTSGDSFTAKNNQTNQFVVRATDRVGNIADSGVYSWAVSNSFAYSLQLDPGSLPAPVTRTTSATIGFTVSPSTYTSLACTLDGVALATCAPTGTPVAVTTDGSHTFAVVVDGLAAYTLSYTWLVDRVPPASPSLFGPPARTHATGATVQTVPSSLGDDLRCSLDGAALVACGVASPVVATGLADGPHSVTAVESDKAGNSSTATYTWVVDTVAPVATITVQTAITGFASVVLNEDGTAAGTSPALALSSGAAVATGRVCLSSLGAVVACTSTSVRTVRLYGAGPLVPGESYVVKVNAPGASPLTDAAGNAAPAVSRSFRAALLQQENSPATVQTWRRIVTTAAKGGSYVVEGRAGATAAWRFTGTAFTAYLAAGPTFGLAKVYVDGALRTTWNQYASRLRFTSAHVVKGLAARTHTVTIVVAGKKGSRAATGAFVGIDAFAAGSSLQRTPSLTQRWARVKAAGAYGLYRSLTALPGETFTMRFAGTGIRWVHPTGPAYGLAAVYVDGVKRATVDSYSPSARDRVVWTSTTLAAGRHTFRIVTLGTKRAVSKGTLVSVDFLQVR